MVLVIRTESSFVICHVRYLSEFANTARCRYNVVQYNMILHTALLWIKRKTNHITNAQKTPSLCSVYFEDLGDNRSRYDGPAPCMAQIRSNTFMVDRCYGNIYPNGPEAGREAGWGSEFVPLKKRKVGSFIPLHKISWTACCFGIRTFSKQYNCYESATIWYTDHQYLAQYSKIINNLQEIPLIFCNYTVRSCGTWYKGPGQSPRNAVSISDLELYVTVTNTGVCDPVTD